MTNSARAKAVQHYATAHPDLAHQLAFFGKLWDIQDGVAAQAAPYTPASPEELHTALRQHRTLLSLAAPEVPMEAYRDTVRAIAALMADEAGLPDAQVAALRENDLGEAVTADVLGQALAGFDTFVTAVAERVGDQRLGEPLLTFILSEAMTPLLRGAAKAAVSAVGKYDWLLWDSGLCPACGTPASSGVVRDEGELQGGRRWLSCPMCRTQWEYARLRCARCGNRSHTELEYLFDTEDPAHRIHVCKRCHGYTPVVFEKELRTIAAPELEEIVMVRLETAASERGFTPLGDETEVSH